MSKAMILSYVILGLMILVMSFTFVIVLSKIGVFA